MGISGNSADLASPSSMEISGNSADLASPSLVEHKLRLASPLIMITCYSLASHWVAHLQWEPVRHPVPSLMGIYD
jgi:hypothetical protein